MGGGCDPRQGKQSDQTATAQRPRGHDCRSPHIAQRCRIHAVVDHQKTMDVYLAMGQRFVMASTVATECNRSYWTLVQGPDATH